LRAVLTARKNRKLPEHAVPHSARSDDLPGQVLKPTVNRLKAVRRYDFRLSRLARSLDKIKRTAFLSEHAVLPFNNPTLSSVHTTVHGRTPFRLHIVDNDAVPASRGHTTFENGVLVARISESIARRARFGEGAARFVVAEQLGHATLGHPVIWSALLAQLAQNRTLPIGKSMP